ncbi:MAG TPA: hypothetical protein DCG51_08775 [Erysipelotrichaceae bacterium]|nr:hypothetical protein [Erysipelotrichaceae bacterium]
MHLSGGVFLLLAMVCSASMAIALRFFKTSQNNRYGMILGNYLTCTLIGFLMIADKPLLFQIHPATYVCGLIGGFLFVLSLVCMQSSISSNGTILSSAFSKLGLLVPLLLSVLFFHEIPSFLQAIGLLFVIASILIMNGTEKQNTSFSLLFLLVVLITNGMSDSMAKIYSSIGYQNEETLYMFILFLFAAFLTYILMVLETHRTGKKADLRDLAAGICIGIPNYFSSVLLLRSLRTIPAVIAYPVFSAGTIVIVSAVSMLLFKEHLSSRQTIGLVLILISLVLLNI